MEQCVIIGACEVGPTARGLIAPGAYVIAADAGWRRAEALGIEPDLVLGDFDSAPPPQWAAEVVTSPAEKDDTDAMLAVRRALALGAKQVVLLGCLGGRADHSYANTQALLYLAQHGADNLLADEQTRITCLAPGERCFERRPDSYLSVFAVGGEAEGVDLEGVKYPLHRHTLSPAVPLGVSNEFAAQRATVRHTKGYLLVMTTPRDTP